MLKSIAFPSSLEKIGTSCFIGCRALETVAAPEDLRLSHMPASLFSSCGRLRTIVIPSLVDSIGPRCFNGCYSVSRLSFSPQSRLREVLSLPPVCASAIEIPDSVEILHFMRKWKPGKPFALQFGPESKLREFTVEDPSETKRPCPTFIHYSSRRLKEFRSALEFPLGKKPTW
jgi:hypothetical protein